MKIISELVKPKSFDEIIGLSDIKNAIKYDFDGAKKIGQAYSHIIIGGSGGLGKTTIASLIANITGGKVHKVLGSELKNNNDIFTLATEVFENDIIIIEEAGGLSKSAQLCLLTWLDEYKLYGGGDYGLIDAPKVVFIFPTTNAGRLSHPLRTRCKILHLSYYSTKEIAEILLSAAKKQGIDLSTDLAALMLLAQSSRGTPRIAINHRLDMLSKVMAVDGIPFNVDSVKRMLEINNIDHFGLEGNDKFYLSVLYDKMAAGSGRPVSRKIMIQSTGFGEDVIDEMIEQYLQQINVIKVTGQGRSLTPLGYEILGKPPITGEPQDILKIRSIDMKKLAELVKDPEIRKGGRKAIAPLMGLRYPHDNMYLQAALRKLGWISIRRAGLVALNHNDIPKETEEDAD